MSYRQVVEPLVPEATRREGRSVERGGGNVGVATSLECAVHPVGPISLCPFTIMM